MTTFRPSEVVLSSFLAGTMGKAEIEHAGILLVRACCELGDEWQAVRPGDVAKIAREDVALDVEPVKSLSTNPFFNPAFRLMVEKGFARFVNEEETAPVEFTEQGLQAISKWVRAK